MAPRKRSFAKPKRQPTAAGRPVTAISLVAGKQLIPILLSAAGYGDRATCDRLVLAHRVEHNGQSVTRLSARADPQSDTLTVDGTPITMGPFCRYRLFHKPYRVLSAFTDPEGRATTGDYVSEPGIYAVGRLDYDSEGLMLLTDDGWLNHRLTHPDFEHPKTYWVQVERQPDDAALAAMREGLVIKGQRTRPAEVERLPEASIASIPPRSVPIRYRKNVPTTWLQVILREGRKRQVRHMTAAVGHPTLRLLRVAIGPLHLGDMVAGSSRALDAAELAALQRLLRRRMR